MKLPSLSFSGCGLHVCFHVAVAEVLLKNNVECDQVCASSGGMAAALYYSLDLRKYVTFEDILKVIPKGRKRLSSFQLTGTNPKRRYTGLRLARQRMIRLMERVLTLIPDAYARVSGKLFVTLTEWPSCTLKIVNHWDSNKRLIQCLRATSNIPFLDFQCKPTRYLGKDYFDGGILCTHPVIDSQTICVTTSPFSQPFSRSWWCKRGWYGEISFRCSTGSMVVMKREFYRCLHQQGILKAEEFLTTIQHK